MTMTLNSLLSPGKNPVFLSLLLGGSLAVLTGCGSDKPKADPADQSTKADSAATKPDSAKNGVVRVSLTQAQYNVAGIQLGQPTPQVLSTTLKVNGALDVPSQDMMSVTVPFGGYIRQIKLEPGMRVRKGQTLVILENPEYIQLQQDYLDTKAKLDYANLEFTRQQELSRDNVNALKVFQQARSNQQSLQAQLAGMAQRLAILRINPAKLSPGQLTRTIVVPSPVSGFISNVLVNNGRFITPSDVIVEIINMDDLHVRMNIFEKDISQIHTGQRIHFGMGGDPALTHQGTIFLLGKSIAADRTISVLAHPDGYEPDYIPGGYVSAQVDVKTRPLPALPESAVVSYGGKSLIYVLEKKQGNPAIYQFQQVEIKPGVRENGYVAITLPPAIDPVKTPIVIRGAYSLVSKLNNSEEE